MINKARHRQKVAGLLRKIKTMRSKDCLLSLSGVTLGIMLASADYHVNWLTAVFMLIAAASLHFCAVFAKGESQNTLWARVFLGLTVLSGLAMLYFSFNTLLLMEPLILMVLGYTVIRIARHSTFESNAKGMVYTFLIFGLAAVCGAYYICSHSFASWPLLFPAASIGLLTLAAKADDDRKTLRTAMTVAGWAAMIAYSCLRMYDPWHYLFVLSLPLFFIKRPHIATFVFSILAGGGFLAYLF